MKPNRNTIPKKLLFAASDAELEGTAPGEGEGIELLDLWFDFYRFFKMNDLQRMYRNCCWGDAERRRARDLGIRKDLLAVRLDFFSKSARDEWREIHVPYSENPSVTKRAHANRCLHVDADRIFGETLAARELYEKTSVWSRNAWGEAHPATFEKVGVASRDCTLCNFWIAVACDTRRGRKTGCDKYGETLFYLTYNMACRTVCAEAGRGRA